MADLTAPSPRRSVRRARHARLDAAREGRGGLSRKLLLLTVLFVLVGELLFFLPSISGFRREWLEDRVEAAEIAMLARPGAEGTDTALNGASSRRFLASRDLQSITLVRGGERRLLLGTTAPPDAIVKVSDLRTLGDIAGIAETLGSLLAPVEGRLIRVVDIPRLAAGEALEVVIPEASLTRELRVYAARVALFSLMVSVLAGVLMYFALQGLIVRPMTRLTRSITRFAAAPESAAVGVPRTRRGDEIGAAQNAFADMEKDVRAALHQKERLAQLGGAVARISHDLRNSLTTAGMVSDRLRDVPDGTVQRLVPRLERAIARAGRLAEEALEYGRAGEVEPEIITLSLAPLAAEVLEEVLAVHPAVEGRHLVPAELAVAADPEHLHRILSNLVRNAAQAHATRPRPDAFVAISARSGPAAAILIEVVDNGPGLPPAVREALFTPFTTRGREGGTGLGLAISLELARANGASVRLVRSSAEGTAFEVSLPGAAGVEDGPPAL